MEDYLWQGGPRFKEQSGVFRLGTDSVMLCHFAKSSGIKNKKVAADLGCGSGVISIILAWEHPKLQVYGVEIESQAAALAAENVKLCELSERVHIIEGDLRCHRELLPAGAYDLVLSNPPYYSSGSGKLSDNMSIALARSEESCTLEDICAAAGYMTRWGGSLMLVHKPERLADIFRSLNVNGFEPKRIRFVQHKSASPPNLVLIEARRGGKPSLTVEAPLILAKDDDSDSDEVRAIYRR